MHIAYSCNEPEIFFYFVFFLLPFFSLSLQTIALRSRLLEWHTIALYSYAEAVLFDVDNNDVDTLNDPRAVNER